MANVSVSSIANDINVSSTLSNISVSDDSGQFLVNVTSTASAITVNPVNTVVEVAASAIVSNQAIRAAIEVANVSGFGNISYDSNIDTSDGIISYVGVSSSDIRSQLSANTSNGITYDDATGIIDQNLNTDLVSEGVSNLYFTNARFDFNFSQKDTDDLSEGTTNLYLNGAGTTDDLAEGSANLWFTNARAVSAITDATIAPGNVTLKEFKETIVDNGAATSGALTLDMSLGSLHLVALNGDITGITLSNMDEGATATIIFEQDVFGGRTIDTTSGFGAWNFMGGVTDLGPIGASRSVLVVTLADSVYQASISSPDAATTDDLAEGSTNLYYTDARSRGALSTTNASASGGGSLAYNSSTGLFTFTPPDLSTAGLTNADVQAFIQENGLDVSANIILNGSQSDNGGQVVFTRDSWGGGYNNAHIIKQGTSSDLKFTSDAGYTFVIDAGDDTTGDSFKVTYNNDNNIPQFEIKEDGNINIDLRATGSSPDTNEFIIERTGVEKLSVNNQGNLTTVGVITAGTNATDTHTFTGNIDVTGNIEVSGNLNYREVEDLLVQDQTITLNYGNASAQDAQIIVDRSGSTLTNVDIKWNETTDKWTFTNDGSTYNNFLTTADIPASAVTSVNGLTGVVVLDTDNIAEGSANLYYTNARADARVNLQTGTNLDLSSKSTSDLSEGTNLYYTDARVDAHLTGGTGIDYTAGTIDLADTAVTPGTYGDASNIPQLVVDQQGRITGVSDVAISIPASYGNVEVADFLANGFGSNTITTTGNISASYFIGDGSLLTNISGANVSTVDQAKTVVKTVIAGEDLAKGDAVYISGGTGDNPEVSKADADDATKMPVFGVTTEAVTATNTTDIVIYGLLQSYNTTGFATGDSLFVSTTPGALTTTKPTGESALLQTVGKVIKGNSSGGKITITGAGRTNATPNLNEGNIFLGSSSDTAITVTPDSNFDTTGNAFSLSNALTDVNSITTESGSGLTFNSDDGTIVTSKFGVNSTVTETANIAGKGFGVFNFTNGTNTSISYSGTDSFEWYEIDGNVTVGSTTMTISSVVRGIDSTTAAVSDIIVGQVIANGTSASTPGSTDLIIFPDDAYVVSVDSGAGTVEMSKPAVQTTSFTHTTDGIILDAGLVDTTTGQVIKLLSSLRAIGSGSDSALFFRSFRNFPFGYPASGPVPTDFDIITTGTASDYSMTLSTFMLGQTPVTNDTTVLNAPLGITIGENTQLTNRGENDILSSFGMNMMWDGLTSYGRPIQPQVLFKSYTDNSEQGEVGSIGGAGPRLFFTSANGNSGDNAFDTYPRANQELGRLSFWGTTGEQLTPSSYSVPSYMSVQAADDWDTWGGGVAGNTNVFMASTASGQAQTYLAFKSGELYLTGSNSNPVTFAPAQSVSGFRPELAYDGSTTTWANINYANTGTNAGAKFTVTNGDSVDAGVVGDMQMSLKRNDNSSNLVTPVRSILSGSASPALEGGKIVFTFTDDGSIGSTLNGLAATVSAPSTIDESIYNGGPFFGSGNETALGNNVYDLSFAFTSAGVAFYYILSGGSRVGYTDIGGSDPYYFVTQTSGMTVTTVVSSGVTAKEWKFNLEEQSDNLLLQSDSVTKVEFTTDETIFSNRVRFQNLDTTAINALTGMSAGDTVYNTTEATLCFYDGSAWQKVDKTAL